MAEGSRFWTTSGTGDGPGGGYSAANFNEFIRHAFMTDPASEGVLRGIGNNLAASGASSPVAINTGSALVYGFFYVSDSSVNVAIPTPTTATRIDRIVLRASWAAQTVRITRIAGTEGGGAPALTQTANTTWDIPLAQVSITTGGVITLTDQRTYIKAPGVYQWLQAALTVAGNLTAAVSSAGGTAQILAQNSSSAANSDARVAASVNGAGAGDPYMLFDIAGVSGFVAGVDNSDSDRFKINRGTTVGANNDFVIDSSGNITTGGTLTPNALGGAVVNTGNIVDGAVTTTKLADANVTTAKIADANVTLAKLAADSVDDTKAGNRVPQFYRRQGGDASNWRTPGASAQTPGAVRMQAGAVTLTFSSNSGASASVTFPTAFSNVPIGYVAVGDKGVISTGLHVQCDTTSGGMTINLLTDGLVNVTGNVTVNWLAIGPE